jgi:hypothetical protein
MELSEGERILLLLMPDNVGCGSYVRKFCAICGLAILRGFNTKTHDDCFAKASEQVKYDVCRQHL